MEDGGSDTSEPAHRLSSSGDGSGRVLSGPLHRALDFWLDGRLSESVPGVLDAAEWLACLGVLVLLVLLVLAEDSKLLSSTHKVISETEWRLIPALTPVDGSASYSTTGVSTGML